MELFAIYAFPNKGYPNDPTKSVLEQWKTYKVTDITMGQSITHVRLQGHTFFFNSVLFSFVDASGKSVDIFSKPEFNPYL